MTVSWYRKWRPKTFSDVIGQDHIIGTLRRSLEKGMVGHAYLFTGPRGVGKTTTARLFAKSVNCLGQVKQKKFDPCGKCTSCIAFENDTMVDVIEIDAASNRGIDDVRALRETITFSPTVGKYKIYIIDEVHMLTKEAFNALLKTLEEPPSHVILILATTDVQKVPDTILSRCQRFDFRPIPKELLIDQLIMIANSEKINLSPDSASLIAEIAYGSGRDAISLLQQLSVTDGPIDVDSVKDFLGILTENEVGAIVNNAVLGNTQDGLHLIEDSVAKGIDPEQIARMVLRLISKSIRGLYTSDWANKANTTRLISVADNWAWALNQIKGHPEPYLVLATAYLDTELLFHTPAIRDKKINSEQIIDVSTPVVEQTNNREDIASENVNTIVSVEWSPGEGEKILWAKIIEEAKPFNHSLSALLKDAELLSIEKGNPGTLNIGVHFPFHKDRIMEIKNRRIIEDLLKKITGDTFMLKCSLVASNKKQEKAEDDDALAQAAEDVFME